MAEQVYNEPGSSKNAFEILKPHIVPGVGLADLIGVMNAQQLTHEFAFKNVGDIAQWLTKSWFAKLPEKLVGILEIPNPGFEERSPQPLIYEIPGEHIRVNKKRIVVHGVFHAPNYNEDAPNIEFPGILRDYANFTYTVGDNWFSEQGLDKVFGISNVCTPLHDMTGYALSRSTLFDKSHPRPKNLIGKVVYGYKFAKYFGNEVYGGASEFHEMNKFDESNRLFERYTNNFQDLLLLKYLYNNFKMPEPLQMEVNIALDSRTKGLGEQNRNGTIQRSLLQAYEVSGLLPETTLEKDHNYIHVLVGITHEHQVVYALQHPDYDPFQAVIAAQELITR
ncbi:MAG TPA: hypothetical protein VMR81_03210 [Patescibacteria group bacterium]|nr:hypothetical protein [Patescibacteria group bacterium]